MVGVLFVALVTGWIAAVLIVLAATIPIAAYVRLGKRGAPSARPIAVHAAVGLSTSAFGFLHTATIVADLGSPGAVAGGAAAFAPGALAFFVLMAHTGIGLQLRRERLKDRPKKRALHRLTAAIIALAVVAHVIALRI